MSPEQLLVIAGFAVVILALIVGVVYTWIMERKLNLPRKFNPIDLAVKVKALVFR